MKRMNFPKRKQKRQEEAKSRQELCNSLSVVFRLARLDEVFGQGAKKERARLLAMR